MKQRDKIGNEFKRQDEKRIKETKWKKKQRDKIGKEAKKQNE